MLSSFALTSLGPFMVSSFPHVHLINTHQAWWCCRMITAMSTKQALIHVLHGKILSTPLSNSVRFLGDWPTSGDESVNDDK